MFHSLQSPDEWPSHIRVKQSPRAKRLALRLDTKARVFHLVIPKGVSLKRAKNFADKYEGWMRDKLSALPSITPFEHGQSIPVLGRMREIDILHHNQRGTTIDLEEQALIVRTNLDDPTSRIRRFLTDYAQEIMEPLTLEKAQHIGKHVESVTVRDTKSRWGSCSHDAKISLSWRLILAPYEAMDYVIAHEVAHLQHLDHSKAFWACCASLCDDYEEGKYWMRHHGQELMSYGLQRCE